MNRLFVLANVYNEAHNLPRMWQSVQQAFEGREVIPTLVVVDGKYPDYEGGDDLSSDGTREFAYFNGYLITAIDYECDKRTAGLRFIDTLASDGDWILNLDADETITQVFGWPERVGKFEFTRMTGAIRVSYGRCRLYRWEPGLCFKHRHYDLYDAAGNLVASLEDAPEFSVVGLGEHYETHPRPKAKADYYRRLRQRETSPWEVAV